MELSGSQVRNQDDSEVCWQVSTFPASNPQMPPATAVRAAAMMPHGLGTHTTLLPLHTSGTEASHRGTFSTMLCVLADRAPDATKPLATYTLAQFTATMQMVPEKISATATAPYVLSVALVSRPAHVGGERQRRTSAAKCSGVARIFTYECFGASTRASCSTNLILGRQARRFCTILDPFRLTAAACAGNFHIGAGRMKRGVSSLAARACVRRACGVVSAYLGLLLGVHRHGRTLRATAASARR